MRKLTFFCFLVIGGVFSFSLASAQSLIIEKDLNFGGHTILNTGGIAVGTTTVPGAGTIIVGSGGIKFPSGTTQTSPFLGTSQTIASENVPAGVFGSTAGKGNYTFQMTANANPVLYIDATSQRVGVATSSPQYTLDVNGNGRINGTLTVGILSGTYNGTVGADNVSAGSFGSSTGGGDFVFPADLVIKGAADLLQFQTGGSKWATFGVADGNGRFSMYENAESNGGSYIATEAANRLTMSSGGIDFYAAPSGTAGSPITWTQGGRVSPTAVWWSPRATSADFYVNSSGNVGIGTISPTQKLTVTGSVDASVQFLGQAADTVTAPSFSWTGDTNTGIFRPAADTVAVTTNGSEALRVTSANNVGIGITNPSTKFVVSGMGTGAAGGGSVAAVFQGSTADRARIEVVNTNTVSAGSRSAAIEFVGYNSAGSALERKWHIATDLSQNATQSFYIYDNLAAQTRFFINNSGNVGIGSTNPGYKLDVQGGQVNTSGGLCIAGDCKTAWSQVTGASGWTDGGTDVYPTTLTDQVGIGTSAPGYPLDVSGTINVLAASGVRFNSDLSRILTTGVSNADLTYSHWANQVFLADADNNDANRFFAFAINGTSLAGATELMRLTEAGSLGVGTTNPGYKLDVQGGQINTSGGLCIAGDCKTAWSQVTGASGWTDGGSSVYLTTSGDYVGIGTASPADALHVNGNVRINDTNYINSTGASVRFHGARADDTTYEWVGFYSGTATRQGIILYDGAWTGCSNTTDEMCLKAENSNKLSLYAASDIRIVPTGGVVIGGTAPDSNYKLTVTGGGIKSESTTQPAGYFNSSSGYGLIVNSGNVGIGTTIPAHKLELAAGTTAAAGIGFGTDTELYRSAADTLALASGDSLNLVSGALRVGGTNVITSGRVVQSVNGSAAAPGLTFNGDPNTGFYTTGADVLRMVTAGADRVTIDASGNVGVGTTTPNSELTVGGDHILIRGSGNNVGLRIKNSTNDYGWFMGKNSDGSFRIAIPTDDSGDYMSKTPFYVDKTASDGLVTLDGSSVGINGYPSGAYTLHVFGSFAANSKNFDIPHPLFPDSKRLVHGSLEGPEVGVYYRGSAVLLGGKAVIFLPVYYDSLTRDEGYTVLLTPKGKTPYMLSYDNFNQKSFEVYGSVPEGEFDWEVKAVRADQPILQVERDIDR